MCIKFSARASVASPKQFIPPKGHSAVGTSRGLASLKPDRNAVSMQDQEYCRSKVYAQLATLCNGAHPDGHASLLKRAGDQIVEDKHVGQRKASRYMEAIIAMLSRNLWAIVLAVYFVCLLTRKKKMNGLRSAMPRIATLLITRVTIAGLNMACAYIPDLPIVLAVAVAVFLAYQKNASRAFLKTIVAYACAFV
ncbi:hypothetical protein MCOR04_003368 [Pyricularia oryzae]|nr:hypothetical protein MCOR04_003368 [Pyricularia oryzae]